MDSLLSEEQIVSNCSSALLSSFASRMCRQGQHLQWSVKLNIDYEDYSTPAYTVQ